jgi:hypothetical protein
MIRLVIFLDAGVFSWGDLVIYHNAGRSWECGCLRVRWYSMYDIQADFVSERAFLLSSFSYSMGQWAAADRSIDESSDSWLAGGTNVLFD